MGCFFNFLNLLIVGVNNGEEVEGFVFWGLFIDFFVIFFFLRGVIKFEIKYSKL